MTEKNWDIIVVGGGHAGAEAASAAARIGVRTLMLSMNLSETCRMSCNPAIGGLGKGHLVREIDALGGLMAQAIDATGLQFRMLNTAKGPAVRAPRAQADKVLYPRWVRNYLENNVPNLEMKQGEAARVLTDSKGRVCGVALADGSELSCRALVITAGTFLDGLIHLGMEQKRGGRWGAPPSDILTRSLCDLGLETVRLKTGTPARLESDSINWGILESQPGDDPAPALSFMTDRIDREQIACAITHTNEQTHNIIRENLDRSPMFSGRIEGTGPRYCPSIEDKIHRFPERTRHQIFLEPESRHSSLVYPNGISTSMPEDVQQRFLRSIRGLENVQIARFGYAIEYVAFPPQQMRATLETRAVDGLYLAGQINGTTGYEEAAALGLIAGANAALAVKGQEPLTFRRDQAYMGVMIDDLITKGAPEPYRMFTSRSEYRLLLRQDNADLRLTEVGRAIGLVDDERWQRFETFRDGVGVERQRLEQTRVRATNWNAQLMQDDGFAAPGEAVTLARMLARPHVSHAMLAQWVKSELPPDGSEQVGNLWQRIIEQVEISAKYEGYIRRQQQHIDRAVGIETTILPEDFDYQNIPSLRTEAAQVLSRAHPATLGQASRLAGVNPADITAILIHLRVRKIA